ncbi:MAG: rhodanese-like domain-containing protein [Actinomycetota bacterium]|nr:rhodanese-like domain-containing protein [Actinomycetota bacterium]
MDPRAVYERREALQILDVREDDEWVAGRIESARHIPLAELPARLGELDRNSVIVTVCRSGNRSGQAADYLNAAGLSAQNMDGGMHRWARENLPYSTPAGGPGRVI